VEKGFKSVHTQSNSLAALELSFFTKMIIERSLLFQPSKERCFWFFINKKLC